MQFNQESKYGDLRRGRRAGPALAIALAVAAPPFLFIPLEIFSANLYDFSAGLPDVLPGLLGLTAMLALALWAALLLVPSKGYGVMAALGVGFALLVWLQGQIVVWDYGVLDGSEIDWLAFPVRALVDTVLWLVVIVLAMVTRKWLVPRAGLIAVFLLLIQGLPAAWSWYHHPVVPEFHRYSFDDTYKFSFSRKQNVVLIIFDAYQADVFHEIIDDDPAWREELDGFTYFRNALAGFSKTYPSLALMLTGEWYDNSQPVQQFIRRGFMRNSLPRELLKRGWRVDLFPHIPRVVHVSPQVASNVVPVIECEVVRAETGRLADLGLFRISPHWLRPVWLNNYQWRLGMALPESCARPITSQTAEKAEVGGAGSHPHAAVRFARQAQAMSSADLEVPAFKLYHLMIPHAPFQLDEELNVRRLPAGREGFELESRAALEVLRHLLEGLRANGVYDNTMVVVVSDHGGGEYTDRVNLGLLEENLRIGIRNNEDIPAPHLASGLPLMLIKPPQVAGELGVSDAPVSLGDVAQTIADLVGLEADYSGSNVFEINPAAHRQRRYLFYRFEGWSGEYLPEMLEYKVDGFSWNPGNWSATNRVFTPARSRGSPRRVVYRIGDVVRFRPGTPHTEFLVDGWSEPNADGFVWSRDNEARLELVLDAPVGGSLLARFDFLPFTARGAIDQPRIELTVNGQMEHEWESGRRGWHEVRIPESVVRAADSLHFQFRFPDAASPFEHRLSTDDRNLGIALYALQVDYADEGRVNEQE